MTAQELHTEVEQLTQKMGSGIYDEFLSEEIDLRLNDAQDNFIESRLYKPELWKDIQTITATFEEDLLGTDAETSITLPSEPHYHNYKYFLRAEVFANISSDIYPLNRTLPVIEVEEWNAQDRRLNPFSQSGTSHILASIANNKITLYNDKSFILKGFKLKYIKQYKQISLSLSPSQTSELPEHTHRKIAQIAAQNILSIIAPPKTEN